MDFKQKVESFLISVMRGSPTWNFFLVTKKKERHKELSLCASNQPPGFWVVVGLGGKEEVGWYIVFMDMGRRRLGGGWPVSRRCEFESSQPHPFLPVKSLLFIPPTHHPPSFSPRSLTSAASILCVCTSPSALLPPFARAFH